MRSLWRIGSRRIRTLPLTIATTTDSNTAQKSTKWKTKSFQRKKLYSHRDNLNILDPTTEISFSTDQVLFSHSTRLCISLFIFVNCFAYNDVPRFWKHEQSIQDLYVNRLRFHNRRYKIDVYYSNEAQFNKWPIESHNNAYTRKHPSIYKFHPSSLHLSQQHVKTAFTSWTIKTSRPFLATLAGQATARAFSTTRPVLRSSPGTRSSSPTRRTWNIVCIVLRQRHKQPRTYHPNNNNHGSPWQRLRTISWWTACFARSSNKILVENQIGINYHPQGRCFYEFVTGNPANS